MTVQGREAKCYSRLGDEKETHLEEEGEQVAEVVVVLVEEALK